MDSAGQIKTLEFGVGSRPGLRSSSAIAPGEPISMGQNASTSLTSAAGDSPTSTTTTIGDQVVGERSRRTSERTGQATTSSVRSSSSSLGREQISEQTSEKKGRSRSSSVAESNKPTTNSVCLHCGASLDGNKEKVEFGELWQMQLRMIDEQRATLLEREAEMQELRESHTRLERRLERQNRRLSIACVRGNQEIDNGEAGASSNSSSTPATSTGSSQHAKLRSSSRVQAKHLSATSSPHSPSVSRSPSPCARASANKSAPNKRPSTPAPPNHLITNTMYEAPVTQQFASALSRDNEPEADRGEVVKVPSWRIVEPEPKSTHATSRRLQGGKDTENLSDEAFLQRHSKHEQEEKRIKRWDMQRVRKQREHEKLLKRYEEKEVRWHNQNAEESREVINTFMPSLDRIESIEVTDDLPVTAFGRLVPKLPPKEFSLPWFNPAKRAAETRESEPRKTRSKAKKEN
eukprot:scpid50291/ scgid25305/ Male-specific lethal 1 homolog; Male-specific lethal 1-like 1; Male-specific lethal-1 homolog 1